jgi:hypothetical protein
VSFCWFSWFWSFPPRFPTGFLAPLPGHINLFGELTAYSSNSRTHSRTHIQHRRRPVECGVHWARSKLVSGLNRAPGPKMRPPGGQAGHHGHFPRVSVCSLSVERGHPLRRPRDSGGNATGTGGGKCKGNHRKNHLNSVNSTLSFVFLPYLLFFYLIWSFFYLIFPVPRGFPLAPRPLSGVGFWRHREHGFLKRGHSQSVA